MSANSFALRARDLDRLIRQEGLSLVDMRSEPAMEPRMVSPAGEQFEDHREDAVIEWREESDLRPIPVSKLDRATPFRYFLDGVQRTIPCYHTSAIPIVAAFATAGVGVRQADGSVALESALFDSRQVWLIPAMPSDPVTHDLRRLVELSGMQAVDTLEGLDDYQRASLDSDYLRLETRAFEQSRIIRQELEREILDDWNTSRDVNHWIVIDGVLRRPYQRAIGLVKGFSRQYLTGQEAINLYALPVDHRTPAFRVATPGRSGSRTMWFLRLRNAEGRDPRHSLVRLEIDGSESDSSLIDHLSSAILAERSPRATNDPRSSSLIYPIHMLERILTAHLDSQLRGWPATRRSEF